MMEEWRPVPGYERYMVSDIGRVRGSSGRILKGFVNPDGYAVVILGLGKRKRIKCIAVHRLVAWAFIGPQDNRMTVNHKDGIKAHNYPDNLEYLTSADNTKHARASGLYRHLLGSEVSTAKLTEGQVVSIKARVRGGESQALVAKELGLTPSNISHIMAGRSWPHIP